MDPDLFRVELVHLTRVFEQDAAVIEHVGSTAIGTLRAKPIIDVLVGMNSYERLDHWREALRSLGYEHDPKAEQAEPLRKVFRKGPVELRTHHLHITLIEGTYSPHRSPIGSCGNCRRGQPAGS